MEARGPAHRHATQHEEYLIGPPSPPPTARGANFGLRDRQIRHLRWSWRGRVRGMLRAPLEESASTARLLRVRDRLGWVVVASLQRCSPRAAGQRQDADRAGGRVPRSQIVKRRLPEQAAARPDPDLTLDGGEHRRRDDPRPRDHHLHHPQRQHREQTSTTGTTGTTARPTHRDQHESTVNTGTDGEQLPQAQGSFSVRSEQPGLAIPSRPVWILEQGYPKLAGQAGLGRRRRRPQTDTFSFGPLDPGPDPQHGLERDPGPGRDYTVHYRSPPASRARPWR